MLPVALYNHFKLKKLRKKLLLEVYKKPQDKTKIETIVSEILRTCDHCKKQESKLNEKFFAKAKITTILNSDLEEDA